MVRNFFNDENGFVVSAELVLVATLLVIGLIVGMSEIQHAVVQEMNDVAEAIGSLNQSYFYTSFVARKNVGGAAKSFTRGGQFVDGIDDCDGNQCTIACDTSAIAEGAHP
jgi:Flp pilus assembly pilin Flp